MDGTVKIPRTRLEGAVAEAPVKVEAAAVVEVRAVVPVREKETPIRVEP